MNATTPEQMNWADYVDALAASAFEARFRRHTSAANSASRNGAGDSARLEMPRPPKAKPDTADTGQP